MDQFFTCTENVTVFSIALGGMFYLFVGVFDLAAGRVSSLNLAS